MLNEFEIKKEICAIGKRIYDSGYIASNDGNVSVKIGENEILCTPTGVSKGFMTPDMICKVDTKGNIIQATGKYKPSSEMRMHLGVYRERPDVKSVVHAHPPYATSFAIAGIPLTQPIMPEAVVSLGCVPIAEYGTPSTEEIPDAVSKFLPYYDAVLLENHGALTYGDSLINAYHKMESLEFYAKLLFISRQLGGPKELSKSQVERLYELRKQFNLSGKHPADLCQQLGNRHCDTCNCSADSNSLVKGNAEPADMQNLVEMITKRVMQGLQSK